MDVLKLYKRNADFEILEIQCFERNVIPNDLLSIERIRTRDGDDFVKVNGVEYESQTEYFASNNIGSKTYFSEEVNR